MKIKVGDKVEISIDGVYNAYWAGKSVGKVVAIVKETFKNPRLKKPYRQEYIVQFSDTWSYFTKNEIEKVKEAKCKH